MVATARKHGPSTGPISPGHLFGIKHYKVRKFGVGQLAWLAFADWQPDIVGRTCDIRELRDGEAKLLIEAMKRLPDVAPEGQGELF